MPMCTKQQRYISHVHVVFSNCSCVCIGGRVGVGVGEIEVR